MAAYRRDRVDVTRGLTACKPGSAPGPTLSNEYGKRFPQNAGEKSAPSMKSLMVSAHYQKA